MVVPALLVLLVLLVPVLVLLVPVLLVRSNERARTFPVPWSRHAARQPEPKVQVLVSPSESCR